MAHYLLACSPIGGHITPMLTIGSDLVARGHHVRMLTGSRFADITRAAGIVHVALPPEADFDDRDLGLAFPDRHATAGLRRARFDVDLMFINPMSTQHGALRKALDDLPADVVLVDTTFPGAIPLLLNIDDDRPPIVACGVVPMMLSSRDTMPFGMARAPRSGPNAERDHHVMNTVVQRFLFRRCQAKANRQLNALGLSDLPVFILDWARLADRYLQFTVAEFEYHRTDIPESVTFTGPVLPADPSPSCVPTWWADLDADRPVIHVTQGTFDNANLDRLIGPAIRALADQDVLVVVSTGGRPPAALGTALPDNVRVAQFLPYRALLPRVDVMITNGGYGGVHSALAHGIPLIVAEDTEEKPEIAARVHWSETGIDMGTGTPTTAALLAAVHTVLTTPDYRAKARTLARIIATCRPLDTIADTLARLTPPPLSSTRP